MPISRDVLTVLLLALAPLRASAEESLVVRPMYLGEAPPPVRSARHVLLRFAGSLDAAGDVTRSREEAAELARTIVEKARAGADFEELAAQRSEDPDARTGAVLGTFAPGMLAPAIDAFLFSAEIGAVSDPIADERGVHVLQRIESHAAVLQILVRGAGEDARARCERIARRLGEGAGFAELARESSEDPASAARGGQLAIYERGHADTLLKAAAFRLRVGETSAPIRTPLGWHLLRRVPLGEVEPSLAEPTFVRLRGILVRVGEGTAGGRDRAAALDLVEDLHRRLRSGADMKALAREFDEDPGGREREGDLGWVLRGRPGLPRELARACLLPVGELAEPQRSAAGYVLLRRDR